jgi:predicted RNase H-like HicB family nuclease
MQVQMEFILPALIRKRGRWYAASCPPLDVHTQGETKEGAEKNLREALVEFFLSCFERGTLDDVLRDAGFVPVAERPRQGTPLPAHTQAITVPLPFVLRDRVRPARDADTDAESGLEAVD